MSCMMLLNRADLSIHVLTSSMARSKFFTYSPYIFRKGASFCRMSPMRGFESLGIFPPQNFRTPSRILASTLRTIANHLVRDKLTTLPCASAGPAGGTAGESSGWNRCWRRFRESRHMGKRSGSALLPGVGYRRPAGSDSASIDISCLDCV